MFEEILNANAKKAHHTKIYIENLKKCYVWSEDKEKEPKKSFSRGKEIFKFFKHQKDVAITFTF